jgi:hypothetical protein
VGLAAGRSIEENLAPSRFLRPQAARIVGWRDARLKRELQTVKIGPRADVKVEIVPSAKPSHH